MSFLIDDILKDKSYVSGRQEKEFTKNEINYSQNNFNILESSLTNRLYYNSFLTKHASTNYNYVSSPIFKHYLDYHIHINDLKNPYTEKYYSRYNYMAYPSTSFNNQILNKTRKGGQIRFTTNQTEELEKHFNSHKYLSPEDRKQLATSLCLSDRQVKTWFQNRRAKWRKFNHVTEDSQKEEVINDNNNVIKYNYLY